MRVMEVVHLRMAGEDPEWLADLVRRAVREADGMERIKVFRHASVGSDLLIHLEREDDAGGKEAESPTADDATADDATAEDPPAPAPKPSELGTRLASLLKEYGMVEHSVWLGVEPCDGRDPAFVQKENRT
jgi:hypothetical protein